ncbi:hypothetical protein [Bacillus changyiensis]|uniref:hypothetical protein n=1 Tax=Bacillus changyiensis TaxID=3004103 RepID=UPI0022E2362B|nr:hypothetical protein [Bacillus changyiensis]MDA1477999.1 hypothetical protein [Bacillus changyiensis]
MILVMRKGYAIPIETLRQLADGIIIYTSHLQAVNDYRFDSCLLIEQHSRLKQMVQFAKENNVIAFITFQEN